MKKSIIALTVISFAAVMISGCANEQELTLNGGTIKSGDIAFATHNTRVRSEAGVAPVVTNIIPFGNQDGTRMTLEESLINLNAPEVVTRGTPAYTENLATLYENFDASIYSGTTQKYAKKTFSIEGDYWVHHFHVEDPFEGFADNTMTLYMWMPTDMTSNGVSGMTYGTSGTGNSQKLTITFDFDGTEVATAEDQQDIMFSARTLSKDQYETALSKDTAPSLLFNHALTGVRFAVGNASSDNIKITKVVFKGLKDKGSCTITPAKEKPGVDDYTDSISVFSSATAAVWTPDESEPVSSFSTTTGYSQTFDDGDIQDWSKVPESGAKFPNSFYGVGEQNLNDADATKTFWFMPQDITEDVTLTISYTVGNSTVPKTWTIEYGKFLAAKHVRWNAGEFRTYTIKVDEVNVQIDDKVHMSTGETVLGSYKDSVIIKNTGNTEAFIRAAIVGQWLTADGDPVFGFTDMVTQSLVVVESWYQDQFGENAQHEHGVFVGLAGYGNTPNPYPSNNSDAQGRWYYNSIDRYYYYSKPVASGATTEVPLFQSYTISKVPTASIAGRVLSNGMYFTLEIATQAISAVSNDGTVMTDYAAAWAAAKNGEKPSAE